MTFDMTPAVRFAAWIGAAATAALAAWPLSGQEAGPNYVQPPGYIAPSPQRPGDSAAGYRALVNEGYVSCGLPASAWRRIAPQPQASDLLPGREGASAALAYPFTAYTNEEGVELVVSNCLTCHAAKFNGKLVVGLGNESVDFTGDPLAAVDAAGAYVRGAAQTRAYHHYAQRMEGIAPYLRTRTIGVNAATNLTWALMAHLDPETMEWSPTPLIEPPPREPLPVSVPPWWRMAKKHAMFWTGLGRGDHARFMLMAAMLCANSVEEVQAVDAYAPDVRAYLSSIEPPRWPYAVDAALAEQGADVFVANCARCHGTYRSSASPDTEDTYPNLLVALEEVGTDPAYARAATDGSEQRFYEWTARSFYGKGGITAPGAGYVPPPLDGVWASAPYLHNGSVPSIAVLLDSPNRPARWARRSFANDDYDPVTLGWAYERYAPGAAPDEPRLYDTTRYGYGNAGHRFGDHLSDHQRLAIIEYLKTL